MKKLLCSLVALLLCFTTSWAEEKVIDQNMLPKAAQSFIKDYYSQDKVSIVTVEKSAFDKDYKVILTSGVKIEFDGSGNWSEIECKRNSQVPLAVIPSYVLSYVKDKFPNSKVQKIEKSKKYVEVELNNNIELKFNSKGKLVEFDN